MHETTKPFDYHPDTLDRTRRFSALTGLEIEDPAARADAMRQISGREFMDVLSVMNGLLRDEQRFQRWDNQPAQTQVGAWDMLSADLVPPAHADQEFEHLFNDIQSNLSDDQDSINQAAVRLYFGIIGAHMFADGNGRTARAAYYLTKNGKLPDDEAVLDSGATGARRIAEEVNKLAVRELQAEAGLPLDRAEEEDAFVGEEQADNLLANYGLSQHLKYIAIRRLRQREGLDRPEDRAPHSLSLDDQPASIQAGYAQAYEQIRSDWFLKFSTGVPLKHLEACMQAIEERTEA